MSASQKITIAKLLITSQPTKAKTIYLELTKQNNHIAQWISLNSLSLKKTGN